MAQESRSQETRLRATALTNEGQSLYREGRYAEAISRLEASLKLRADNEVAVNYLELARERAALQNTRTSHSKNQHPNHRGTTRKSSSPSPPPIARTQKSGLAHIGLNYNSPLNSGLISITVDGEALTEIHFDFTTRGFLGLKRKGSGLVKKSFVIPSGRHKIGIELTSPDIPAPGRKEFAQDFPTESRWNLRIDQPKTTSNPSFFLLRLKK
jgi:hypothetical protein